MNNITTKYHEIGENLIPAIAYGDAAGLPYEKGPSLAEGSVRGLVPVSNDYLGTFPEGTWSDDTQLSLAVLESLLACEGFVLDDQADMHVLAMRHSLGQVAMPDWVPPMVSDERALGWGEGSNVNSAHRLMGGVEPSDSGEPEGGGNGVLMKLAPLVYWQLMRDVAAAQAANDITQLTRMTHQVPEATVSSLVHADVLKSLMQLNAHTELDMHTVIKQAVQRAEMYEQQIGGNPVTSELLGELANAAGSDSVSPEVIVGLASNGGFYAPETLVMAYGSFLRESVFPNSVYRAVELGGDTDSVASIVGSMSVCAYGVVEKPHDFDKLYDVQRLTAVSRRLAQAALRFDR